MIVLVALIFGVTIVTTFNGLGFRYLWIDRVLHFSAGFSAAALFISAFRHSELNNFAAFLKSPILTILLAVSFTALIGVLWEFYEFGFGDSYSLADTIEDLRLDLAGGFLAALLGLKYNNASKN